MYCRIHDEFWVSPCLAICYLQRHVPIRSRPNNSSQARKRATSFTQGGWLEPVDNEKNHREKEKKPL